MIRQSRRALKRSMNRQTRGTLAATFLVCMFVGGGLWPGPEALAHVPHRKMGRIKAQRSLRYAHRALRARRYQEALALFHNSYGHDRATKTLFLIARCYQLTYQYKRAAKVYRQYLREVKELEGRIRPARHRMVKRRIKQMLAKLAYITLLHVPKGTLVTIDGERIGRSPFSKPIPVNPGRRVVVLTHPVYRDSQSVLFLIVKEQHKLYPGMQQRHRPAFLFLTSNARGARVSVGFNDYRQGSLPNAFQVSAGTNKIKITAPGYHPKTIRLKTPAYQLTKHRIKLRRVRGAWPPKPMR